MHESTSGRTWIGDLGLDRLTQAQTIEAVDALIRRERGGYVVTPNVDHLVLATRHEALRRAHARAALSLADGQPLVWMSRLLRAPVPEKVSGSDLLDPLMAYAARANRGVFFFGSTPDTLAIARERFEQSHPALRIVGQDTSFWRADDETPAEESRVVRAIRESGAEIVVLALSCPRQEQWMERHADAIAPAVAFGLGASLDFAGGVVRRAPRWMSRAGLEWLYRLAQEPRRMAYRYLVRDMQALPIFARALWNARIASRPVPRPTTTATVQESSTC